MRVAAFALATVGAASVALGQATFSTGPATFTSTHVFTFQKGGNGDVVNGFSIWVDYIGDGGGTWASDTNCMVQTPDGQQVSIGGFGTPADLDYDYQGSGSADPGIYTSGPHFGFIDGGASDGVYTVKLTQDFGTGVFADFQVLMLRGDAAVTSCNLEKVPDQGPFWQPLSPGGSEIYANSFVACATGPVDALGMWLESLNGPGQGPDVRFEVWGSIGDDPSNGPDAFNVLATTGSLDLGGTDSLEFYGAPTTSSAPLSIGKTYWFVASCFGEEGGNAGWRVGGHTQNTGGINDNGTFWFSNDDNGVVFDGQALTPEMAFRVSQGPLTGPDCYPDCNGDGVLNILDFVCFQLSFTAGCP